MTQKEARKIVKWFKRTMNMEDWKILLFVQDDPPEWHDDPNTEDSGGSGVYNQYKSALVWVSNRNSQYSGDFSIKVAPEAALIHELLHVLAADVGWEGAEKAPRQNEQVWNTLGQALYRLYKHDTGRGRGR